MNFTKLAQSIAKLLKEGEKNSLKSVCIKRDGVGFYYDLSTKQFIPVQKRSEMYYLPIEKDENGNSYRSNLNLEGVKVYSIAN